MEHKFKPKHIPKTQRRPVRGTIVNVDLNAEPGLAQAFHDLKDAHDLSTKEMLLQMVSHCVKSAKA